MDVGKLFKLPQVSSSAVNKRKWDDAVPIAQPINKAARVEDEAESVEPVIDTNQEEPEDEEDRRFFSGGITDEQAQILDIMDREPEPSASASASAAIVDLAGLRKLMLRLERAITKNAQMRVKYADDPARFIDSEADLDAELKGLFFLASDPRLFYPEFIKLGGVASLVGLLSHENADISAAVIEVLDELTDAELGQDRDTDYSPEEGLTSRIVHDFVDALIEQNCVDLLVSNLERFHDRPVEGAEITASKRQEMENDAQAIYHTLSVLLNLLTWRKVREPEGCFTTNLFTWILTRIARVGESVDQNTAIAAELLADLTLYASSCRVIVGQTRIAQSSSQMENGLDVLLGAIARFRKRSVSQAAEEIDLLENTLDTLDSILKEEANQELFLQAEGVELMVLLLGAKTCKVPRLRFDALRVLAAAMWTAEPSDLCLRFVESQGLAPLFSLFMTSNTKGMRITRTNTKHILIILDTLFACLPSDSEPRYRLLAKFVSSSYAKLDRLVEIRIALAARVDHKARTTSQVDWETGDEYLNRLFYGLDSLQLIDTILAWLILEDDGAREHIAMLLSRHDLGFAEIRETLQELLANIDSHVEAIRPRTQDVLKALIAFLETT